LAAAEILIVYRNHYGVVSSIQTRQTLGFSVRAELARVKDAAGIRSIASSVIADKLRSHRGCDNHLTALTPSSVENEVSLAVSRKSRM
jgi:hypothetical protein